jgi:CRISPR-associated protein Cas1
MNQRYSRMIKRTLCFSNPAYLSTSREQLVIAFPKETEKEKRTVPIEDIGVIVLEHQQITLSNALLEKLAYQNAAVISCNAQHLPVGLLNPLAGHSEYNERVRNQLEASVPLKKNLWQQTIVAKITNQANLLAERDKPNAKLRRWANDVLSGDSSNRESHSAAYYWDHLFDFTGFYRGQKGDPPNNLLNYGYAVLRAVCARSLIGSGMLPVLGIHHANKYNAYCLADDIMEPYRPYVDALVCQIIDRFPDYEELNPVIKQELLRIPAMDVVIDGKKSPLLVGMSRTTSSLNDCFAGVSRKILYPNYV